MPSIASTRLYSIRLNGLVINTLATMDTRAGFSVAPGGEHPFLSPPPVEAIATFFASTSRHDHPPG